MTPAQLHKHVQERYQILDRLGHGIMGTVYRAIDKTDRSEVAIKVVLRNNLRDKSEHTALTREIQVLRQLDHPNIVSFRRAFEDDTAVYIVTEYCSGGDLFNYLNVSETALPEREALLILRQLLHAMDFLRKKGISHRDIKPENILMCEKGKIKLADLGLCFFRSPNGSRATRRRCGTLQYTAPEVLYHSSYEPERSDMWSSGVVLYAMLTQRLPYRYNDCARLKHELRKIDTDAILQSRRLYHLSGECLILLGSLLQLNPAKRPNPMKAVQLVDNALLGPLQTRSRHMPW